ncbi:P-selectin glycoprotein ligand 1 [Kogia breviceps]|uniref:P-selectin glycoprotein ligand 1 n=1 Tax=Kogia breviceps TaxID=27615 RepID=UPI0027954E2D|nr:P-selectin glycoprotein ligand 1 isoform X1 [Kogia breviceps]XP_058896295.1 P-selectin glycoprotein ligand 1 isoform X1 [Kogia breviceps]XP_058896296.1 P-selectin glycoprotein ligand 1 isoform X1 [Kogia breviceps]
MFLKPLLLLALLGPGSSLQLWGTWENGAKEAPGPLLVRGRREVDEDDSDIYDYDIQTDPPEMLNYRTEAPKLLPVMRTLEQRESAGPLTPEPTTLEVATRDPAVLDAGGAATGNLSVELVQLVTLTKEPVTVIPPTMEDPSTESAAVEALSTGPAGRVALATEPAATEALSTETLPTESASTTAPATERTAMEALSTGAMSTEPTATAALSTEPTATAALSTELTATEALSTEPTATEALSTEPTATAALSTEPTATEALSTESTATEALFMEPTVIEAPSTELATTAVLSMEPTTAGALPTDPATVKTLPTRPATARGLTTAFPVPSDPPKGTIVAVGNSSDNLIYKWKNGQSLFPRSSMAPSPAEGLLDPRSVKQCLLAILILALVATIFLVCTVVLAIRLSRKNHLYPVRNYSATEMVCISSLLPEGGEGPAAMANGGLPKAKSQGPKAGSGEDREGDDLTLHSFLP